MSGAHAFESYPSDLESLRELQELLEHEVRLKARRSLTEFARLCGYEPQAHHLVLCRKLEQLARGEVRRLIITMPPGAAKSTYTSVLFPAWYFAQPGAGNVIAASHTTELAERFGRKVRGLVTEHQQTLGFGLSEASQAAGRWETDAGREYYAAGVGVGIAGFRSRLSLIDDPIRSRQDADSKLVRDRVWDWFNDDLSTRLIPGGSVALVQTRWHEDDLAGRLIARMEAGGEQWEIISIPAIAGPHDPLGRLEGEWLWDDDPDYEYGKELRKFRTNLDTRSWSALYQQQPTPDTGDYFKREWLIPVEAIPPRDSMRVYGGSDYAVTAEGGDYTVHAVLGVDYDGNPYLLDVWRRQASSDVWIDAYCDLVLKWKPIGWAEEQGQIRSGIGPFLDKRSRERRAHVARDQFPTRGDKAVRAQSFRGLIATRGLRILASAPWRADLETELLRFPAGVHDDQVDALGLIGQLLDKINGPQRAVPLTKRRDGWDSTDDSAEDSWKTI